MVKEVKFIAKADPKKFAIIIISILNKFLNLLLNWQIKFLKHSWNYIGF